MSDIPQPITVAELIERLQSFDQSTLVMVKCEDDYYSGPLVPENIENGEAGLIGPYEYESPVNPRRIRSHPGGWVCVDPNEVYEGRELIDRRAAVFICAE